MFHILITSSWLHIILKPYININIINKFYQEDDDDYEPEDGRKKKKGKKRKARGEEKKGKKKKKKKKADSEEAVSFLYECRYIMPFLYP